MDYAQILGFVIFFLVLVFDIKILRIDFKIVRNFLYIMLLMTLFRFVIFGVLSFFGIDVLSINKGIELIEFWRLFLVFWEDAFFAITIYYMVDKLKLSPYLYMPIVAALSISFGLGHIYQFKAAFFLTLIIPYFVFYRAGKAFGFGTSMICHVLFDVITVATFYFYKYIS